jgi:hypothetical protein
MEWITENALFGHLEGISSLDACPTNCENEDVIANMLCVPGEIRGTVGVSKPRNNQTKTHSTKEHPFQKLVGRLSSRIPRQTEEQNWWNGGPKEPNAIQFVTHHFQRLPVSMKF